MAMKDRWVATRTASASLADFLERAVRELTETVSGLASKQIGDRDPRGESSQPEL
jgi:hypothetical protein